MGPHELDLSIGAVPPTSLHRWLSFASVTLLFLAFGTIAPFASTQLLRVNSFVPTVAAINCVSNLATAGLLFKFFSCTASRALLVLASGYLFSALIVIPWALTFPGAFAPTGLLGAGLQSTPWLFTFWNFGFSASVIGYGCLKDRRHIADSAQISTQIAVCSSLAAVIAAVCTITWGVTTGQEFMPRLFFDEIGLAPIAHIDTGIILTMCGVALFLLWTRCSSILDLWLVVAMCALSLELIVITWMISSRFSLGFYFCGVLSCVVSIMLLTVLLLELDKVHILTILGGRRTKIAFLEFGDRVSQPLTGIAANAAAARNILEQSSPDIDRAKSIIDAVIRACFRADEVLQEFREIGPKIYRETERETLIIQITERNQFDGIDPPLRPGDVARVVRCERDEELHQDRIYWLYHVHEDALVGMLFARVVVHQGRIMFALHGGTIISPDDAEVAGILSGSDHQSSLNR